MLGRLKSFCRSRAASWIALVFSLSIVVWLLSRLDLEAAGRLLWRLPGSWLSLALAAIAAMFVGAVARWKAIVATQPEARLSWDQALRAQLTANVYNCLVPAKAGELSKAFYLQSSLGRSRGAATIVLERLIDLLLLGLAAAAGSRLGSAAWGWWAGLALSGAALLAFSGIILLPLEKMGPAGLGAKIIGFRQVFRQSLQRPQALIGGIICSVGVWFCGGLALYALLRGLGEATLAPSFLFEVYPLMILAGLMPLTVSGLGSREAAFVLLAGSRLSAESATLAPLAYTFLSYWLPALVSLGLLALLKVRDLKE